MTAQAVDGPAVAEILALLSDLPIVTTVTLQGPGTHGGISIIVRKAAQQREGRTQYRYSWEIRVGAGKHAWERVGGLTYERAAAAYQAAVEAVQAALRDEGAADAADHDGRDDDEDHPPVA